MEMADTEAVNINLTSASELTSSLIEQLGKAFVELEAHKVASTNKVRWNDVQEHLHHMESTVKAKLEELEAKEKVFAERESHNGILIAEREAAVIVKEQELLDKVQDLKDAAVATIAEARTNRLPESLALAGGGDTNGNQLTESFPPVPLLRAYLKELRRNCQGNGDAAVQNKYNTRELEALRAVIECVEEYKLEATYPLEPLHKRVAQLDKTYKGDKKRTGEAGKLQEPKRPRSNGEFQGPRGRGSGGWRQGRQPFRERAIYTGLPERYPPVQSAYNYPASSISPYAAQASNQGSYYYAQDSRAAGPYSDAPSYGTYTQSTPHPYM